MTTAMVTYETQIWHVAEYDVCDLPMFGKPSLIVPYFVRNVSENTRSHAEYE